MEGAWVGGAGGEVGPTHPQPILHTLHRTKPPHTVFGIRTKKKIQNKIEKKGIYRARERMRALEKRKEQSSKAKIGGMVW